MLSCFGARCCTSTNAKPVSLGNDLSNCSNASRPPADAPTPTTDSGCAFVGLPRLDETCLAACGVVAGFAGTRARAFLSLLEGRMFGRLAFFAIKTSRKCLAHTTTKMRQPAFLQLPQGSIAFRTSEDRRRSGYWAQSDAHFTIRPKTLLGGIGHKKAQDSQKLVVFVPFCVASSKTRGFAPGPARPVCNLYSGRAPCDIPLSREASRAWIHKRGRGSCEGSSSFRSAEPEERAPAREWLPRSGPS